MVHLPAAFVGTAATVLACRAVSVPGAADANGVFFRVPPATVGDINQMCNNAANLFKCKNVFETGMFGTQIGSDQAVLKFLGSGSQGPGLNHLQDATEGELHPHKGVQTPNGLANIVNLAGREVGVSVSASRRMKSLTTAAIAQMGAPYYLTFLQQEERLSCKFGGGPQHACPDESVFRLSHSGKGVTLYAVGEDVSTRASDVKARVSLDKFVGERLSNHHEFCEDWQGTHTASLAAGVTHGVAKGATIVPVAVKPGCRVQGTVLDLLKGLQWVHRRKTPNSPAVVFISTKYAVDQPDTVALDILEDLVRVLTYDLGATIVAASGANAIDATNFSPGRMQEVITVGGLEVYNEISMRTTISTVWLDSNYGDAIDIWAPAAYIDAAFPLTPDSTATYSGVPQATALVAGVAASLLEYIPNLRPEDVRRELRIRSSENLMIMTRPRNVQNVLQIPSDWATLYAT